MADLYTPKTIQKIRNKAEIKRNFLTGIFFGKSKTVLTEEIILECTKGGEYAAPFITPMESGRPIFDKKQKSNIITAPNIGVEKLLTPKDMFVRPSGMNLSGDFDPAVQIGARIGEILSNHENYITNKEEVMVGQFLTTGKVVSIGTEADHEVDYEIGNIDTLDPAKHWTKDDVNPLSSLDEIIANAESAGVKIENIVMGFKAANAFINNKASKEILSKDLQSEFVKKAIRKYPGVVWLGTYSRYGIEIFRYKREIIGPDKEKIDILPTNIVIGGPSGGEILYAPVVNMGKGDIHVTKRYSTIDNPTPKIKKITTESRPVLQPCDLDGYFSVVVCEE